MAWKPKSSRKPNSDSPDAITQSGHVRAADLSEELLQVNICKNENVIVPQHLRVPESEQAGLMFGSFGAESNSTKSFVSASREFKNGQESSNGQASSTSASISIVFEDSVGDQSGPVHSLVRTANDSVSDEADLPLPLNDVSISPHDIKSYLGIGLIQSHAVSYKSQEPQEQQGPPILADFLAYDPEMRLDTPFSKITMKENAQGQDFSSTPEALSYDVTDGMSFSSMSWVQHQQPFTQLFPQVHISHYPNIVPYQQIVSSLYVLQLLVPNYSTSSVPTHPSRGSNYFMMPGGNPQFNSGGMKYGPSQYETVQACKTVGYGTYTNSDGCAVGTIEGTTGMVNMTRISSKDSNLYAPNPQSDVDMWIQTPRGLAILQSTSCYSLSGHAQTHPANMPGVNVAKLGLNQAAFTSPNLQCLGLYQTSQQGSLSGQTNNIVHQQVLSGSAGNAGMGMVPTAAAQVGAYQPSQLGHLGWTNNY